MGRLASLELKTYKKDMQSIFMSKRVICTDLQLNYWWAHIDMQIKLEAKSNQQRSDTIDLFGVIGSEIEEGWAINEWILDDIWSGGKVEQWGLD